MGIVQFGNSRLLTFVPIVYIGLISAKNTAMVAREADPHTREHSVTTENPKMECDFYFTPWGRDLRKMFLAGR